MECICGSVEVPLLRRLILGGHDAAEVKYFFSVAEAVTDAAGSASALSELLLGRHRGSPRNILSFILCGQTT